MNLNLLKSHINSNQSITITGSKSETNRLLVLQAIYPKLELFNCSNSDDSQLMTKALNSEFEHLDIHHAGTAMRFLTAYLSTQKDKCFSLTGSERMQQRPISILVDALREMGADIQYSGNEGYPPLRICGIDQLKSRVSLEANVSSQYISALCLIAPSLNKGLRIQLNGEITSVPYINMTLNLLQEIGVETSFENNTISIAPFKGPLKSNRITVESDWSSASYFYSIIALSPIGTAIELNAFKKASLQGDSVLSEIYKAFGVSTTFFENKIVLQKESEHKTSVQLDLVKAPDIAQTIAVSCLGLGMSCKMIGLHTLKIKETDRLVALKTELEKLGGKVAIDEASLSLTSVVQINPNVSIDTYNDHRMAMAFAPLALVGPITINDAKVVSKSYPRFWEDLKEIGFQIK
ncbi:MAG: 3-phosphoshikimate 1-carboxyvinyltransferase [Bacteroidetes bacterium MedPE-SWsnd-G2]|nr:MAG: 3-phosphoshikimate 1-carboxyvinyltransferase [Bacteroidetes bacterium MedPE-SWsnd-G2]